MITFCFNPTFQTEVVELLANIWTAQLQINRVSKQTFKSKIF